MHGSGREHCPPAAVAMMSVSVPPKSRSMVSRLRQARSMRAPCRRDSRRAAHCLRYDALVRCWYSALCALGDSSRSGGVVPTGAGPNPNGLRRRLLPRPFPNARRPDCPAASVVSSLGPWRFEPLTRGASSCYNVACERMRAIVRAPQGIAARPDPGRTARRAQGPR
jgi:hypothetical protein